MGILAGPPRASALEIAAHGRTQGQVALHAVNSPSAAS